MLDDLIIKRYLINAFAQEFNIGLYEAKHIVEAMELYTILIERYWEQIYEKIKGE